MKTFPNFWEALAWGRTYAREHCHAFHTWRVERAGPHGYAIAIRSKNTGTLAGFISA